MTLFLIQFWTECDATACCVSEYRDYTSSGLKEEIYKGGICIRDKNILKKQKTILFPSYSQKWPGDL